MSKGFLLHERFIETCKQHADSIAFVQMLPAGAREIKYAQIHKSTENLAAWLIQYGIKKQDRVAIILDNSPEWSIVYFGILLSGAVAVPIDIKLSDFEIYNLLADSEARIVFTLDKFTSFFKNNLANLAGLKKIVLIDKEDCNSPFAAFKDIAAQLNPGINFPDVSTDGLASIIYTSGTVAKPKGVMLTQGNFSSNFLSLEKLNIGCSQDCFISILPLHHAFAFTATLIFPLFLGARIIYPTSLKSDDILEAMRKNSVTFFVGVPEIFNMIHKAIFEKIKTKFLINKTVNLILSLFWLIRRLTQLNLSKLLLSSLHRQFGPGLRFLVSGGAKLDSDVASDFFKLGFTILEGYGLTETAPVVSFNLPSKYKIGSVGRPIEGVSVKISNNNEILISGDNVMEGYFRNPPATNEVLKDGWFYSGDSGYIDKDGYIFITGRLKEMIVLSSGKNIYPEEVENYFKKSDFIKEICLLPVKNAEGNEVLAAVVVPNFEYFKQVKDVNINRKIKWELENFSSRLPSYKHITNFLIVKDELPKTRLGKIKRYEVASRYLNKFISKQEADVEGYTPSLEDINIINSEIGKELIALLYTKLSLKRDIRPDDHLELDLGLDSLARVELALGLQNVFKVKLPDSLIAEVSTVRELILKLKELQFSAQSPAKAAEPILSWKDLLNMPPPDELKDKIDLSGGGLNKLLSFIVPKLLFIMFRLFCLIKVKGRENLPTQGNYILCSNHASYLDGFILAASAPFKTITNLYFLGDKNIFGHPAIRWSLKTARLVPIDPTKELISTLQVASYILRHNKMLCIFPEGLRSFEGKPVEFKKGIGILVKELEINPVRSDSQKLNASNGVKIIPVAIVGSYQAWPRTRIFPRPHPIKIIFGKPLSVEELLSEGKKTGIVDDYQAIAFAIKREVEELFYNN